jgi:hypothetical protein
MTYQELMYYLKKHGNKMSSKETTEALEVLREKINPRTQKQREAFETFSDHVHKNKVTQKDIDRLIHATIYSYE